MYFCSRTNHTVTNAGHPTNSPIRGLWKYFLCILVLILRNLSTDGHIYAKWCHGVFSGKGHWVFCHAREDIRMVYFIYFKLKLCKSKAMLEAKGQITRSVQYSVGLLHFFAHIIENNIGHVVDTVSNRSTPLRFTWIDQPFLRHGQQNVWH